MAGLVSDWPVVLLVLIDVLAVHRLTRLVTEDVITFGGVVLSAQKQFTEPKRNVALTSLSPLED